MTSSMISNNKGIKQGLKLTMKEEAKATEEKKKGKKSKCCK